MLVLPSSDAVWMQLGKIYTIEISKWMEEPTQAFHTLPGLIHTHERTHMCFHTLSDLPHTVSRHKRDR